jgi:NADH dehydrogenase [ubiquinone] 1 alpha subcomplex assembly factor 7
VRPLRDELQELIALEGPLTVERYMALCLQRYYGSRDPLGRAGDFITAPEISQMFGELLGLWAAATWQIMGAPSPFRIVELGPGRGTLMSDALRATARVPGFLEAARVDLVETSSALRDRQAAMLGRASAKISWHASLEEVPPGPAIVIANEFFDALPVRQFVRTERGWCERLVGLEGDRLAFGLAADAEPGLQQAGAVGEVLEIAPTGARIAHALAERLARGGGAALILDYGYWGPGSGDTVQAVKRHAYTDPLEDPGEADLTTHVDFAQLAGAAASAGAAVHGVVAQGAFLRALGIEARAAALKTAAGAAQAADIDAALQRLTARDAMGELFKVLAIADPRLQELPGLPKRMPPQT